MAAAAVFTQEASGTLADGSRIAQTVIQPDAMPGLRVMAYELGAGRRLEIHTNLDSARGAEIDSLAAVVGRCYGFLETATGRRVPGGVLLYVLEYPRRPRYYRFRAEVDDSADWNEIRVALLQAGNPLVGPGAGAHVTEFIFDTLPHELTHSLLTAEPTVRHDLDGHPPLGTRWFIEGVCEKLAKDFAAAEAPEFLHTALRMRHLDGSFMRPELGSIVWKWGQASEFSLIDETELYGLAMMMVTAWLEHIDLTDLLDRMSRRGGDIAGEGLLNLLRETTGMDRTQLLAGACNPAGGDFPAAALSVR